MNTLVWRIVMHAAMEIAQIIIDSWINDQKGESK